jgi:NAD(P)-dependent dehydrogenase (short-subunit alcohol dehydrogenase family)
MELGLKDKVAVVTGGTSGIGLETARLLLSEGVRVAICGRNAERLAGAIAALNGGKHLLGMSCDVLDKPSMERFRDSVSQWSGGQLNILVNNAGQGRVSTFAETTDEAWREELELKFFSQIHPLRAFLPLLRASTAPSVVIVNSLLSLQPELHMVATSAARAGVQNLSKSLAGELAPDIRVNTILLGLVESGQWQRRFEARPDKGVSRDAWFSALAKTKGIPLGRLGKPDEAARAIVYLGSPAASYITGASLEVSGGVSRFM